MIREIINFTKNLLEDIPDVMEWKVQPSKGLHIFIDIDNDGKWKNQNLEKGKDYDYYDGKNSDIPLWNECIKYQNISNFITMNKVQKFDSKQKIHSCSPFVVAFNFNFNDADKDKLGIKTFKRNEKPNDEQKRENEQLNRNKRIGVVKERLNDYAKCSQKMFWGNDDNKWICQKELCAFYQLLCNDTIFSAIRNILEFNDLIGKDYIRINLRSVDFKILKSGYEAYLKQEIFNGEMMNGNKYGALGFLTTFTQKKIFLRHRTSSLIQGVNQRFTKDDALIMNDFTTLLNRKVDIGKNNSLHCLPNPLPIIIDQRETNKKIISIFNKEQEPIHYRELITKLFEEGKIKELSNYYLLNYVNTMSGLQINDFDFVPMFRYNIDIEVFNVMGLTKDNSLLPSIKINTIFDLEKVFNNLFIRYLNNTHVGYPFLIGNYFGDKVESQKSFKPFSVMKDTLSSFYKYRESIYDYIYKSKTQSITARMFDDMVYSAILSDMQMDEYKNERHTMFFLVRWKINIWFSLYKLFNKNSEIMASKITDLMSKMKSVSKGEGNLEISEEFAFGAGQIVSYLIDRSVASDKTYAMLEPYLQKSKSGQLQDAIAQTIGVYKHDISTYRGKFQFLASNVLTYDANIDMKPLLKYFLAGCFSPCEIYVSEK